MARRSSVRFGIRANALPDPYRVALYYVPEADDPLWARGCEWLGRNPETGVECRQPGLASLAEQVSEPRRYGFHATLKPPMRLAGTLDKFLRDVTQFCRELESFIMPSLGVTVLGRFIALCPTSDPASLHALADACVASLDAHRLPEDEAAQTRRATGRTASQLRNLARWGYPFVMEDWRFHLTLSNPTANEHLTTAAKLHFADALTLPRRVTGIAVFAEHVAGEPFRLLERISFGA
jgi:hypothetical protein